MCFDGIFKVCKVITSESYFWHALVSQAAVFLHVRVFFCAGWGNLFISVGRASCGNLLTRMMVMMMMIFIRVSITSAVQKWRVQSEICGLMAMMIACAIYTKNSLRVVVVVDVVVDDDDVGDVVVIVGRKLFTFLFSFNILSKLSQRYR